MAATALSHKLPSDLAEYIVSLAASTRIQAATRGMLARVHREPRAGDGFDPSKPWAYKYAGESFVTSLESWCRTHYRPGVYMLIVSVTHPDHTQTTFGKERVLITPTSLRWTDDLLTTAAMYLRAFSQFHGEPWDWLVRVSCL